MSDETSGFAGQHEVIRRHSWSRLSHAARDRGEGAFLADAADNGFTASSSVEVRFESADARLAELLAVAEGAEITVRDRVMRADGVAVMVAVSRPPRELTRGTAIERPDAGPGGSYARLEEAGHRIEDFRETVSSRMPTRSERSLLELPEHTPVLAVTRVALAADGVPLESNDMVLPADRYELSYRWPAGRPLSR